MIGQITAELRKLRTTRTTLGLVLGMIVLVLLSALLSGLLRKAGNLTSAEDQRDLLGVGGVAGLFSGLAGVLLVTSEYRFGTIRPTFLFTPQRARVLAAKLVTGVLAGVALGLVGEGLGLAIGYACLRERGIPFILAGGSITLLLLGTTAGVALWGAIGVGVASIVRNQIGTIVGMLAWGLIVENLLFALVPSVGRLTPGEAQNALSGLTTRHLLSATAGGVLLVGWTTALALAGFVLTARRDVS